MMNQNEDLMALMLILTTPGDIAPILIGGF
jgi:hypothetical protein